MVYLKTENNEGKGWLFEENMEVETGLEKVQVVVTMGLLIIVTEMV